MSDIPANDLRPRVAVLEEVTRGTRAVLERIERRLDAMETRLDQQMRTLDQNARSDFRWLLGTTLGWGAALLAVMAHGFHWI